MKASLISIDNRHFCCTNCGNDDLAFRYDGFKNQTVNHCYTCHKGEIGKFMTLEEKLSTLNEYQERLSYNKEIDKFVHSV